MKLVNEIGSYKEIALINVISIKSHENNRRHYQLFFTLKHMNDNRACVFGSWKDFLIDNVSQREALCN